ncbi:type II toxin-antitoxin system Phd/YefM family antitoxin [Orbaceae bacterium ac157xtp]
MNTASLLESMTDKDAESHFGKALTKAQHASLKITKNGNDCVVMMSIDDFNHIEQLKAEYLKSQLEQAKQEIKNNTLYDHAEVFATLA